MSELRNELISLAARSRAAQRILQTASPAKKDAALAEMANALLENADTIFAETRRDLEAAKAAGIPGAMLDRLALNEARLSGMATGLRKVAALPDPTGLSEGWLHKNGMHITRTRVPLGVLGIIYEARPNVTADAASLAIKSGNTVILRGGKEALLSNRAIVRTLSGALQKAGLPADCVLLIESADRAYTNELLTLSGEIDALIPRGGKGLIQFVKENARVPVIETGAGNCHVYVHEDADLEMALPVLINAKTSRPSVCNSAEHLLLHRSIAEAFLPRAAAALTEKGVVMRGCERCRAILPDLAPVTEDDFETEYDDLVLSIKVVDSLEDAIAHINRYGTRHSEAILTRSLDASRQFSAQIDAACVYTNASTRFTDGEEFGFGAEIGISTQKLHARGPMGLKELTTVKYIIEGSGQIRE